MKIVFLDYESNIVQDFSEAEDLLEKNGHDIIYASAHTEKEMEEAAKDADAIICIGINPISGDLIRKFKKCRVIVRYGIGFDSVDIKAAGECGIIVCNIPGFCIEDVATHTMSMLLSCLRELPLLDRQVKEGNWDNIVQEPIHRLSRMTVGFVGFGRIARKVAEYLEPWDCRLVVYDPYLPNENVLAAGASPADLKTVCQSADIISVHTPQTEETYHLIDKEQFSWMKDGVIVLNMARGGIICETALTEALQRGKVRFAGLDVLESNPQTEKSAEILSCKNVILTPHRAASSIESQRELKRDIAISILTAFDNQHPYNMVNKAYFKERDFVQKDGKGEYNV